MTEPPTATPSTRNPFPVALGGPFCVIEPLTPPLATLMAPDPPLALILPVLLTEPPTLKNCTAMPSLPDVRVIVPLLVIEPPTVFGLPDGPNRSMATSRLVMLRLLIIEPPTSDLKTLMPVPVLVIVPLLVMVPVTVAPAFWVGRTTPSAPPPTFFAAKTPPH